MTSKASSIQPRPAAMRVRRCPRGMVKREKAAAPGMEARLYSGASGSAQRESGVRRQEERKVPRTDVGIAHLRSGSQWFYWQMEEMEVAAGLMNVGGDLGAKFIHGRKLDFRAQAAKKEQLHLRFRVEVEGMEVEEMSFDGERFGAKSRAFSHVGYRIETFLGHARAGDVNAIARDQFLIAAEVN